MKRIKLESSASRDELLDIIKNSELVNDRVKFDENKGKPLIHVREKGERIKIKCEMVGGPTKDNGFLEGTYFVGKLTEKDGKTRLSGIILTAPIYHTLLALLLVFYVYRCISLGAFNPVPLILLVFSIFMFRGEFEKQGTIERYLNRAFRRAEQSTR
ncbi:MAG: hypothetical protein IJW53_05810 [Clostridia bacterium]|nr:hypothetical protein [Clostridia bacterium]